MVQCLRVHPCRWRRGAKAGEGEVKLEDVEDLEAQMEEFLKKQAAKESGMCHIWHCKKHITAAKH
jgi:hypothetical protein